MIWKCVLKVGKSSLGQRDNSVSVQRRGIVWREVVRTSTAAILRCTRVELMALFTAFVTSYCPLLTHCWFKSENMFITPLLLRANLRMRRACAARLTRRV